MLVLIGLSRLCAVESDQKDMRNNSKKLGESIRSARYDKLTQWQFETPEEVTGREQAMDARFDELARLHAAKKPILEDHLAREQYKSKVKHPFLTSPELPSTGGCVCTSIPASVRLLVLPDVCLGGQSVGDAFQTTRSTVCVCLCVHVLVWCVCVC